LPPDAEAVDRYPVDPDDPAPFGPDAAEGDRAPFDAQQSATKGRADVRDYSSAPLDEALLVVGDVRAEIWWSCSSPDGDLYVQLLDVHPDGRALYLTDGILRARFREGFDRETPLPVGEPVCMAVDLWHLAHEFAAGHRIRLRVQPSALDRFDVNSGTGGPLADDTGVVRSEHAVHAGPARPSRLVLPEARA